MVAPTYAPMPMRFTDDLRLTAQHIRVLGVVAGHDRFAANKQTCNADHKELARKAGCHPKSLSRSLRALVEFGYIEVVTPPDGKRHRRAYRVYYNGADAAMMARPKATKNATIEDLIDDRPLTYLEDEIGNNAVTEIGNNGVFKSQQIQGVKTHYNIYGETTNKLREAPAQKKGLRGEEKDSDRTYCEGDSPGRYQRRIAATMNGTMTTIATRTVMRGTRDQWN